jgi:hypothetical protein
MAITRRDERGGIQLQADIATRGVLTSDMLAVLKANSPDDDALYADRARLKLDAIRSHRRARRVARVARARLKLDAIRSHRGLA